MKTKFPDAVPGEEVYADLLSDAEENLWGVFGLDSGHCYASYCDETEAQEKASEMNTAKEIAKGC